LLYAESKIAVVHILCFVASFCTLQSNGNKGKIILTAHADGLEEGSIEIEAN